ATRASVALAPLASVPTVQTPVPERYEPVLGVPETKVNPAGSRSVTCTPVALLGPLLVAVRVKVTLLPKLGVALSTVLVTAMSAAWPDTVADAESLAGRRSGGSPA